MNRPEELSVCRTSKFLKEKRVHVKVRKGYEKTLSLRYSIKLREQSYIIHVDNRYTHIP